MTYQGVTATFDEDAVVAITGADMSPTHNGDPIDTWTTVAVEAGDELELSFATEGPAPTSPWRAGSTSPK